MQYTVKVDWAERELRGGKSPSTPPKSPAGKRGKDDECASTAPSSGESEVGGQTPLRFSYDKRWLESLQAGLDLVSAALLQAEAGVQKTEQLIAQKALQDHEGTQLCVTGLPLIPLPNLEEEVRRAFETCGTLLAVSVHHGAHRAAAFLIFEQSYGATLAVQALDSSRWPSDPAADLAWAPLIRVTLLKRPGDTKPLVGQVDSQGKLFIGGLPKRTTEHEVAAFFGQLGRLAEVHLVRGHHSEVSCFVQFTSVALAHFAIKALHGTYWNGHNVPLTVRLARANEDTTSDLPARTSAACPQFFRTGACSYGAACKWSHASSPFSVQGKSVKDAPLSPRPRGVEKKLRGEKRIEVKREQAPCFSAADFPALGQQEKDFPALGGKSPAASMEDFPALGKQSNVKDAPAPKTPLPKGGVWA